MSHIAPTAELYYYEKNKPKNMKLEYRESMGSPEAHVAVLRNRIDHAKADYDRAVEKGIPAQIETTKREWERAKEEYEEFLTTIPDEARNAIRKETAQ